jgi:hypothetical protein
MYGYTSNKWSHWNSNEKLKEKFGGYTRKTLDRFATKGSYTWNITHNTESTRKKRPVTRDDNTNNNNNDNNSNSIGSYLGGVGGCSP